MKYWPLWIGKPQDNWKVVGEGEVVQNLRRRKITLDHRLYRNKDITWIDILLTMHYRFNLESQNHSISWVRRDPQGSASPTPASTQNHTKINHMSQSIIQMLLDLWQAQSRDHFPVEPLAVTSHYLSKEPFPNIQHEPPLSQLHAFPQVLSLGTTKQRPAPPSSAPLHEEGDEVTPWSLL